MSWLDDLFSGSSGGFDPNDPYAGNTLGATPDVPPDQLAADARADPNVPAFGDPYAGNTIGANAPAGGWGAGSGSGTGKPLTQKIADALTKLGEAGKGEAHQPAPVQARLDLSPRSAQSQAFRGQSSLGTLLQLLMQQRGQYGPPGVGGGGGGRGLLGM
jgi:hypothetical protein